VKDTVTRQLPLGAIDVPHVFVCEKSPLTATPASPTGVAPPLVNDIDCAGLAAPTACAPNDNVVAESVIPAESVELVVAEGAVESSEGDVGADLWHPLSHTLAATATADNCDRRASWLCNLDPHHRRWQVLAI
jgi:hypothetical protein